MINDIITLPGKILSSQVIGLPVDYSKEYLTTIAREDGTISFNIWKSMGTDLITSISYSIDDGATWTTTQNQNNKSEHLSITVNVSEGDKILWKGNAQQTGYFDDDDNYIGSFFSSTCEFDVQGNIMSLLYEDNFENETTLEYDGQFCHLFNDFDNEIECKVINASNLVLPATTLVEYCYYYMFYGCTSLTTAPSVLPATTLADSCYYSMFKDCTSLITAPSVLPATTLAMYCYQYMFYGCTSLTTAPQLPATTLANNCYSYMFNGCTSLVTAPELPATILTTNCYSYMFNGCTNLVTTPELPAKTLANYCYQYMFYGCTSLTTAPQLPATTLADYCYHCMFYGCTSLATAPELPAKISKLYCYYRMFKNCMNLVNAPTKLSTSLAQNCYGYMFEGCISLVKAPELPATTLVQGCYNAMFHSCVHLNYIKALFTTTPNDTYTNNWVKSVATSGTFVKNSAATWNVNGNNGIPNGWNVYTEDEYEIVRHYEIKQADWNQTTTTAVDYIKNKPTIPSVSLTVTENDTNAVSGGAVYSKFADLIGSAPAALDTLQEIAYALNNDADLAGTLTTQISSKITKVSNPTADNFASFNSDGTIKDSSYSAASFITQETQSDWEEDDTTNAAYINNKPIIKDELSQEYEMSSYENSYLVLEAGDTYEEAFSKIEKAIVDNEYVISSALNDLNDKINEIPTFDTLHKLSGDLIEDGTINKVINVQPNWNESDATSYAYIQNKPTISTTITENDNNPVSGGAVYNKFADLIGSAPEALDTLQEIAYALNNDADLAGTLTTQISSKVPKVSSPTANNFASFNSDGTIKDSSYSASSFISSIKTVNNESLIGTGNVVVSGLPQVSSSDNGKILMVVNGQWQLVSPSVLYSGQGLPNNAQGNNGDLYMQTD